MKYYYIYYYTNHLDYPDHPYFTLKLDHEPTKEEIIKNKPIHHQPYQKIDGYYVKYRYETTINEELLVSRWKADEPFHFFSHK